MLMENFVKQARCIIIYTRDVEMANEPGAQRSANMRAGALGSQAVRLYGQK